MKNTFYVLMAGLIIFISCTSYEKEERGAITEQPGHVIDIMSTILDLAGGTYPETYKRLKIFPMVGKSLFPVLRGKQLQGHETLFWEHFDAGAILQGDWKLYNLVKDRTEVNNVASENQKKNMS